MTSLITISSQIVGSESLIPIPSWKIQSLILSSIRIESIISKMRKKGTMPSVTQKHYNKIKQFQKMLNLSPSSSSLEKRKAERVLLLKT